MQIIILYKNRMWPYYEETSPNLLCIYLQGKKDNRASLKPPYIQLFTRFSGETNQLVTILPLLVMIFLLFRVEIIICH